MCFKKDNIYYNVDKLGKLSRHHMKPRVRKGKTEPRNISFIPEKLHTAYHFLFRTMTPSQVAEYLNKHFIDPDFKLICVSNL